MSNDTPITDDEVVALARAAIDQSREDISQRAVSDTPEVPRASQQPGITIDLSHRFIARLPEEVIDVIRTEIERLALSSNLLTTLPSRLTECTRLRYLNVRHNLLREIPDVVFRMPFLEILDIRGNKLKVVPKEIANLTSLKVLSVMNNKIEELPVCLGDMTSLQVLKLDNNPIRFPPPDVLKVRDYAPSRTSENEKDTLIATQVKAFMKDYGSREKKRAVKEKLRFESSGDESWNEGNLETPRPSKRVNGGRFPVRPSISHIEGVIEKPESPGLPPPIPMRSHYRGQSQQTNLAARRPAVSPLMLANGNERNRSQSEGAGPNTIRAKRMGIYNNKSSDLGSVDELRRSSHFRGFSQGLPLPNLTMTNGMSGMQGPATAVGYGDHGTVRPLANRPLSDVWEHKRGSGTPDVVVEAAKNFLYAISQLSEPIYHMVTSIKKTDRTKEGLRRKEDFCRRFSTTYMNVRSLNELLQKMDTFAEEDEDEAQKLSKAVYQHALKCLDLFLAVMLSVAENRAEITQYANPRILRSFLFLQQSSLIEMRNACSILGADFRDTRVTRRIPSSGDAMATVRAPSRGPLKVRRFQTSPPQRNGQYQVPRPVVLHSNETSRTNTLTSISAATPRSGESFVPLPGISRTNTLTGTFDEADEDAQFERIYARLRAACECCRENMPQISKQLKYKYEELRKELDSEDLKLKVCASLIEKCDFVERLMYPLAKRLSQMQLKDAYARSQPEFWQQCIGFIKAWGDLAAASTTDGRNLGLLSLEVKQLMKPLHRTVKEASLAINDSTWANMSSNYSTPLPSFTSRTQPPKFHRPTMTNSGSGGGPGFPGPINTSITSVASAYNQYLNNGHIGSGAGSGGYITPVPATPLSAALGPAAQATVPNTPNVSSQGSGSLFAGGWEARADRYLNQTARRV
ncbi:hypothetical protein GQ43DRAFT_405030 [Delitschia confertaspora ATCC 74209]|uniref:Disease resistance R13L4/SHOC-2-like LRR domain-containing protein n=1 Tax=Delitschia confertaspora ATCC 74209 TaxID=1513339 RepID=A0A9P4JDV1_9PLEO|nr:hypothetical protein GQ43DRAFT_405030 [Delitschia confertaspora ATCC 74209]